MRLPRSGFSLAEGLPATAVTLMAPAAHVGARSTPNPRVAALIASVMRGTNGVRPMFADDWQFPSLLNQDLPRQADARGVIERGPPLLRSWLPFRRAVLPDRLSVLALPLLTIGLPLLRFAPPAWRWQHGPRIRQHCGEVPRIARRMKREGGVGKVERQHLPARPAVLDRRAMPLGAPRKLGRHLCALRRDIEFLRRRLQGRRPVEGAPTTAARSRAEV